ncbi:hypothetical protein BJY01DRAFT_203606 [Aspergillus pseudoustus]|uniref:Tetraspanin Tsp3 n=1 Tax=Aspergillus pseudoustus TaxID=1810923 RepID=A0ABR4KXM3_9EURO
MPINWDISSALYPLLFLASAISLVFGALSWTRTTTIFLPLPTWIPVLTTLFPPLTLIAIASTRVLSRSASNAPHRWTQLLNHAHTIILSIIATVALTYLYPEDILTCHLNNQWQYFFQHKDARAIRAIQDRYQCCGLRSIHDRAWPFKDHDHGDNACEQQLGYRRSCFEPWRGVQRQTSWMVVAAVVCVLIVKIGAWQIPGRRISWMNTRVLENGGEQQRRSRPELEEGEHNTEGDGDARRALLPRSRSGNENVWDAE